MPKDANYAILKTMNTMENASGRVCSVVYLRGAILAVGNARAAGIGRKTTKRDTVTASSFIKTRKAYPIDPIRLAIHIANLTPILSIKVPSPSVYIVYMAPRPPKTAPAVKSLYP